MAPLLAWLVEGKGHKTAVQGRALKNFTWRQKCNKVRGYCQALLVAPRAAVSSGRWQSQELKESLSGGCAQGKGCSPEEPLVPPGEKESSPPRRAGDGPAQSHCTRGARIPHALFRGQVTPQFTQSKMMASVTSQEPKRLV